jgi:hypothetical protein
VSPGVDVDYTTISINNKDFLLEKMLKRKRLMSRKQARKTDK